MVLLRIRTMGVSYLIDGFDRVGRDVERLLELLEACYGLGVAAVRESGRPGGEERLQALLLDRKCSGWDDLKLVVASVFESAGGRPLFWTSEQCSEGVVETLSIDENQAERASVQDH